jgi:hypothetical protein
VAEGVGTEEGECGGGQGVAEAEAGVDAKGLVEGVGLGGGDGGGSEEGGSRWSGR